MYTSWKTLKPALCTLLLSLIVSLCAAPLAADTIISENIGVDTVWTLDNSPYVVTNDLVVQGTDGDDDITSLIIEPGVEVRFNSGGRLTVGGSSGDPGALIAQGTADSPILFTAGIGDPPSGFWYGLAIANTADDATTLLQYCTIEYAGYSNYAAITVNNAAPTITHCGLVNNAAYDMAYIDTVGGSVSETTFTHGLNFSGSGQVVFTNNIVIWDDNNPVRLPADNVGSFVATTTITGLETSTIGGIEVTGGTLTRDATWTAVAPYVIVEELTIAGTDGSDGVTSLTLEPGVTFRFNYYTGLYVADTYGSPGALMAVGTESLPILFTANSSTPSSGEWRGIVFQDQSVDVLSGLTYCTVEYGGLSGAAVTFSEARPIFRYNTVRYNASYGLTVNSFISGEVVYDCNSFYENRYGIFIDADSLQVELTGNSFSMNQNYAVLSYGSGYIWAPNNWWGDANGPNQSGDAVFGNINYENWLTEPSACASPVPHNDPPNEPGNPSPQNGAVNVPFPEQSVSLNWSGGDPDPSDIVFYHLRWGDNPEYLTHSTEGYLFEPAYSLYNIAANTTYYWQVLSFDNHGVQTVGPVWQFTTATGQQPDFVISDIFMTPAAPEAGQTVTITATVQNVGTETYTGSLDIYLGINGTSHNQSPTVSLAPNESAQVVESWSALVGAVVVTATVDPGNNVEEADEENNSLTADLGTAIDTTAPEVYDTLPVANAVEQQVDQVDISIQDHFGGTIETTATSASISVFLDGGTIVEGTISIFEATTGQGLVFRFTPQTSPLVSGHYLVSLTTADTAGNGLPYSFEFTVDSLPPDPPVITGGAVTSGTMQIRPALNLSNSTTFPLTGTRDDETDIWINGSQMVSLGSGPWNLDLTYGQGQHTLEITSRDAVGNISEPAWVDVLIDSVSPVISTVTPAQGSLLNTASVSVSVSFTESGSGVDMETSDLQLLDRLMADVPGTWQVSSDLVTFVPDSPFNDGTYTLQVQLRDGIGNTSAAVQLVFTVDTQAPPIPVIEAVTSPTHTLTQTIRGSKETYAAIIIGDLIAIDHTSATTWQYAVTLESGENLFSFAARDRAGNQSEPVNVAIVFDDIAPPAITTLTADGQGSGTAVRLDWSGYNEAAHGDIQSYRIFYDTSAFSDVAGRTAYASVPAGTFNTTVDNLATGTAYWFAVVPVDIMDNFTAAVTCAAATPSDTLAPENVRQLSVVSYADRLVYSWQPSADSQGDLAGYKVYFNGAATPDLLATDANSYEATGLTASESYPFIIKAYDVSDNDSSGSSLTGYTWLDNPTGLSAEAFNGYVRLSWSAVTPATHLRNFAVYASSQGNFSSVAGMTPVVTPTSTSVKVPGLVNNQTYYFSVAAVNRSGGIRPDVTTISATPVPDQEGPQLSDLFIGAQPLVDGLTITQSAQAACIAVDPSGISRVVFIVDGAALNTDYQVPYQCNLDLLDIADGAHTLAISAFDTLDNQTQVSFAVAVALAVPEVPVITAPDGEITTNQATLTVAGTAERLSQVTLYLDGQPAGVPVTAIEDGHFAGQVTLNEGVNRLQAAARNRTGMGPQSSELLISLDTTRPLAPRNPSAQTLEAGTIRLTWTAPEGKLVTGYDLYRSDVAFDDPASATQLNSALILATSYRDLPAEDGTWYYRVVSRDDAGNQSDPSALVSAVSDREAPRALSIDYTPHGNVDPVSQAVAPGRVDVELTVSEPLLALPFLSITPEAGQPISVSLSQLDDTHFTGHFDIEETTPSGTAYAVFSTRDWAGNRGTEIDQGLTLLLDTDGPSLRRIVLDPVQPIRNDSQAPVTIALVIGLNEAVAASTSPVVDFLLSGAGRTPMPIINLAETTVQAGDMQTWQGTIDLPADAGELEAETLQLVFEAEDQLGNISTRILAPNQFQVYQGDLPPLAAPAGLSGEALSGGRIELTWNAVPQAVAYQLYRQAPNESELTWLARIDGPVTFMDATQLDGDYAYAVTSIRDENGQEAESGQSPAITVAADAQAPSVPQNLTLELRGSGILAHWQGSYEDGDNFNLYRSDGTVITAIDGLTPLDAVVSADNLMATDTKPSPTDHCYVVTAVDDIGNESAPSESAYLNFDLLPVATLTVEKIDDQQPQLAWTHPGGDIAGFDVYMGPVGQAVQVNDAPLTELSITDSGYAGDAREYSVLAVDDTEAESPQRTLYLPALDFEKVSGSRLRRGVMNKLTYTVTNRSDLTYTNLQLHAQVAAVDHHSDNFRINAGQSIPVSVIIGGYEDLLDSEPLATTITHSLETGLEARLIQTDEIMVGEGMLTLLLYTNDFTRGGTGEVWFSLENSGDAEIEVITALRSGNDPSDEMVFSLLDDDANILSTLNFQQAVGAQIYNLTNRTTVARIPAGAIFESRHMAIPVPLTTPDEVTLRLDIANIYANLGDENQVTMRGFGTTQTVRITETEYFGDITTIDPAVTVGMQDVTISGQALMRDSGQPVSNAPLNLIITLDGFERAIDVITDDAGAFDYVFTPLQGETGTYKVAALHPDLLDRPMQATFTVTKVAASPAAIRLNMPKNYTQSIPIEITSGVDTQVTNLRLAYEEWDQPADAFVQGLTYDLGQTLPQLSAGETGVINLTLSGDNSVADNGTLVLQVVSDETDATPWCRITVQILFSSAEAYLTHSPYFVESGALLGEAVTETITLANDGLADLEGVTLSLIGHQGQPLPDWAVLNARADAGTLAAGESREVSVTMAPAAAADEGFHIFYLRVQAADYATTDIPIYLSATPSGIGNVLFKVKDIYTGSLNESNEVIQGMSGARITLQNEKNLTLVYNDTSDEYGEALFANLAAGVYKYRLQANGYQEKIGRLWIKPGLTTSEEVFLEYNLVTVEWEVVETTIQDHYDIVLNIVYETDVPAPVVVCEPASVALPDMKAGDVFNGEMTLTNHGLVRADNVTVNLPENDEYIRYELMVQPPDSLGAKDRVVIPYRLTCLKALDQAEEVESGGGSGCYRSCTYTKYHGTSSNGCPYSGSVPHCHTRPCEGTGTSHTGGAGIPVTMGPGGGGICTGPNCYAGGNGIGGSPTPISTGSETCTPEGTEKKPRSCPAGDGEGCPGVGDGDCCQSVGSDANLIGRSYTDQAVDMTVKVPGGVIEIKRSFYNTGGIHQVDEWRWNYLREARISTNRSATVSTKFLQVIEDGEPFNLYSIKREEVTYSPDEDATTIDFSAGKQVILRPALGTDRFVYAGDQQWRWESRMGDWELYNEDGHLLAFGNRQGTLAKLIYDDIENDKPQVIGMADRNDRQVIWMAYDQSDEPIVSQRHTYVTIHDIQGRSIEYDITNTSYCDQWVIPTSSTSMHWCPLPQTLLHRVTDLNGFDTLFGYEEIQRRPGAPLVCAVRTVSSRYYKNGRWYTSTSRIEDLWCSPKGLTKVTDPLGREEHITYGNGGALTSVLDHDGNGYTFEYLYDDDQEQYYVQKTDTNGKITEYWFDEETYKTVRVDVNGRTVKTIDKDERTYTLTDENGNQTVYTYDQWDNLTHVAYPDGNEIAYQYDLNLQKVTRKIDENHIATRYIYDDQGRLTRRVEADGTSLQRTTEFGYDTDGYLTTIRRPGDPQTAEALTTLTYDADGNMDTLTDPEGNITRFTYDVMGNVLTKTDARDKVWTYTYDNTGRLRTITDPLDLVTEYVYDEAGNKIREIDPEGKETVFEYDARDNLKKAVNPALEQMLIDTTFDGRVLEQTDGEGRTSRYQYDTDGRLSATVDGNGNTIAMAYEGDTTGCATCGGSGSGDQPTVIEFPTFTREIKYDGRGRKYAERDLFEDQILTTRYTYDPAGNLTTKTDAEGRVTSYLYDDLNRLTRVEDPEGKWTQYAYDKRDNLIALTDAEDQTTLFEYDRNNRLVKEIRPMGEETAYAYDGAGNLIEKIDAKNQRTAYGYDNAGRLVQIDYYADAADTAPAKTVTFTYDDAGNLTGYDDGTTSGVYNYDDADRKTTETVTYPGFDLSNTYTYYKNGLKQTYTGPDAITMGYLYDNNNQLTGVQIPNVGLFTVNEYQWNRPAEETLPGGGKRQYQYDPLMRVTEIETHDPGDNQQLNYAYTYDKVDNITAKQTEHGDYAYQYDALYRLTDVDNPDQADEGFTYDGVGNRLTSAATTGDWTYNINNELEGYDTTTFQYDANGNMIEKNVGGTITRFFYNLEDRLERVENGSGTVIATYYYDPFGRRLWKDVAGTRTCFHYSDEGLVGEYDAGGTETKTYGWKPGSTWSTDPLFMKVGSQYYWYHNDHLGTPQMMTTSSGAVVWKARYTSFGKATVDSASTVVNPLRFPGHYEDAETGLHYNWFRYYSPDIGKYISIDPIGFFGGDKNLYAYVLMNPIRFADALGLRITTPKWFPGVGKVIKNGKNIVQVVSNNSFTEDEINTLIDKIWEVGNDSDLGPFLKDKYQPLTDPITKEVSSFRFTRDQFDKMREIFDRLKKNYPDDALVKRALLEWENAWNKFIYYEKDGRTYCYPVLQIEGEKRPCPPKK